MTNEGGAAPAKAKRKVGVAAALAGGGLGKPTPPPEVSEEEKGRLAAEERERRDREERERHEREERERQERDERERRDREERERLAAEPAPPTEQRRGPGRPKTLEGARRGRSFRASDPEYQAVYDTLDALFTKVPPSVARRIEPSAIVRAALRIAKQNPDLVLKEIQEQNDFT